MYDKQDPRSGLVILFVVGFGVFMVVADLIVRGLFFQETEHQLATKTSLPVAWLNKKQEIQKHLSSYQKSPTRSDVFLIPIDRAMQLVTDELSQKKPPKVQPENP